MATRARVDVLDQHSGGVERYYEGRAQPVRRILREYVRRCKQSARVARTRRDLRLDAAGQGLTHDGGSLKHRPHGLYQRPHADHVEGVAAVGCIDVESGPCPHVGNGARVVDEYRLSRVAVLVDGCFWHSLPSHGNRLRNNAG